MKKLVYQQHGVGIHVVDIAADFKIKAYLAATHLNPHAGSKRKCWIFGMLQTLTRL